MKKLIYFGMGLLLCLSAAVWTSCEKQKEEEPTSVVETPVGEEDENYVETAFGMEMAMVYVAGGAFRMGATEEQGEDAKSDEKPAHKVTLDSYYIGKFEVTQAQWEAVMGTTISQQWAMAMERLEESEETAWLNGVGDTYPMYYVSREETQAFCDSLSAQTGKNYRLPTEAEWEYAARGGQKADGTKYVGSDDIDEVAWFENNSGNLGKENPDYGVHPVGTKKPNGLDLYDMSGNVLELCLDWYGYYGERSVINPQGPNSGTTRVMRGGSWIHSLARDCRVSSRGQHHIGGRGGDRFANVGFRVVCER